MRRHPLLLGAIAAIAATGAVVTAGAFSVPSPAAVVDGTSISRNTLNAELEAIASNSVFSCYLQASVAVRSGNSASLPSISGSSSGSFDTAFVDFWLSQRVDDLLVERLAAGQHLAIDARALAAGRADLMSSMDSVLGAAAVSAGQSAVCAASGAAVLTTLPSSMVDELVRAQAAGDLVLAHAAGYGLSQNQLSRYFALHSDQFQTICLSAIQVATPASAAALRASIEAGGSFAALAKANSTDQASAANGGALGCFTANQGAYQTVATDVKGLAVGQVSQPIANNGSYLLLMVTRDFPASFDAVVPAVRHQVLVAGSTKASAELHSFTKTASISIDPRYGQWSAGVGVGIAPPTSPRSSDLLNPNL